MLSIWIFCCPFFKITKFNFCPRILFPKIIIIIKKKLFMDFSYFCSFIHLHSVPKMTLSQFWKWFGLIKSALSIPVMGLHTNYLPASLLSLKNNQHYLIISVYLHPFSFLFVMNYFSVFLGTIWPAGCDPLTSCSRAMPHSGTRGRCTSRSRDSDQILV